MKKNSFTSWIASHKIGAAIIAIAVVGGSIGMYRSASTAQAATQYVLSPVSTGDIIQSVSGSGTVAAVNQLDVSAQVSGTITSIAVKVGQHVQAGDLLATIDPTDAADSLKSAQLSLDQLTGATQNGDIPAAESSLTDSYSNGFSAVQSSVADLETIMPGLHDLFYSQNGFLSDQHATSLSLTGQSYRNTAGDLYDKANAQYQTLLTEYNTLTRGSATSSIAMLITDTQSLISNVATTLQSAQTAIIWITNAQPNYQTTDRGTAEANVASWTNSVNGDLSSLASSQTSIANDQTSLEKLQTSDPIALQNAELQLQQAQKTYSNYFVRAPFAGIVGRIPASVYSQAGSAAIATIIGDDKIANISLDEVDAAKVKVGDPATVTFDAISGLTATGTVSEVDLVGTVSGGVVSYGIKISINTVDTRILPGMSLNTTITTSELDNVVVVPSSAVKTSGGRSYVQVLNASSTRMMIPGSNGGRTFGTSTRGYGRTGTGAATSTGAYGSAAYSSGLATTSRAFGSTTGARGFGGAASGTAARAGATVTVASPTPPQNVYVTIGQSDSTNTQIVSGLAPGQLIVTRTISGTTAAATTAAAPSLLNSIGGARTGAAAGGTFRAGGAARGGFGG